MREAPRSIRGSSSFWLVYLVIYSYAVFFILFLFYFFYHRLQVIVLFLQSNLIINHQGVHVRI